MGIVGDLARGVTGGLAAATPTGAISAVADVISKIIDRVAPDPNVAADIKARIRSEEGQREIALAVLDHDIRLGQIEVNKVEAASGSWFAASWRPAAGWVGVSALFFSTTVVFAVQTGVWLWQCIAHGALLAPPQLDTTDVWLLLGQMLGLAGLRSVDKYVGTAPKG